MLLPAAQRFVIFSWNLAVVLFTDLAIQTVAANMAVQKAMTGATRVSISSSRLLRTTLTFRQAMKTANQINSPEKLSATMNEFQRQSAMMDMHEELLDELLEDSSQESEVEELVGAVFDEIGLELNSQVSIHRGRDVSFAYLNRWWPRRRTNCKLKRAKKQRKKTTSTTRSLTLCSVLFNDFRRSLFMMSFCILIRNIYFFVRVIKAGIWIL